jgi:N-ethylmaleimide reductase
MLEVTDAAISVWGPDRVGVRLAPSGSYGSMFDSDPSRTFGYATEQIDRRGAAWLHVIEPRIKGTELIAHDREDVAAVHLRPKFSRALIAAGGFTRTSAEAILTAGHADLVAFGRHFISNPDLPERFRLGQPVAAYDRSTFYGGDARGYTDYPALSSRQSAA